MDSRDPAANGSRPLTVLTVITPQRYSGAERMAVYLADGLRRRGHRVVFACKRNELLLQELAARGLEAHPLPIAGKVNPLSPCLLAWLARRLRADLIHTHLSTAALWGSVAGKLAHLPTVASVHALNRKTCFLFADLIATCSEGVRQHLLDQGVAPERVQVLYNGVYPEHFEGLPPAAQVRRELQIPPGAPVIGAVAHLSRKKGQEYLLRAAALLRERWPDLICLLVGEGVEREPLTRLARHLGLGDGARFLGYRDDAPRIMQAMDVVVLPSVAKEGLGVCLIEAAFLGKPVVGSDAPGIREVLVDGDTGLLAPVADAEGLAASIAYLLEDPGRAADMGARGRDRARRLFTVEAMARRAEQLYRDLLTRPRGYCYRP
jgi:glycosyltransferase involved in cell wall biosynthesis